MKYWIKERHNPQYDKPYYVACGKLSEKFSKRQAKSLYGFNVMRSFDSKDKYEAEIQKLKSEGCNFILGD